MRRMLFGSQKMRLGDADRRWCKAKAVYPNHRSSPWLTEDASHDRSNRWLRGIDISVHKVTNILGANEPFSRCDFGRSSVRTRWCRSRASVGREPITFLSCSDEQPSGNSYANAPTIFRIALRIEHVLPRSKSTRTSPPLVDQAADSIHLGDPMQTEHLMVTGMTSGGSPWDMKHGLSASNAQRQEENRPADHGHDARPRSKVSGCRRSIAQRSRVWNVGNNSLASHDDAGGRCHLFLQRRL